MKKSIIAITSAALLGVVGLASHSALTAVEAQDNARAPVILTVSMETVVAQSKAGQTIPGQAEEVRNSVAKELEAEQSKLQKDIENFQKNAELMSEEVRQQTGQELQARAQYAMPQRQQIAEQAFRVAIQNAQVKIINEAQPIMKDIIERRGATVMLDTTSVLYAAVETDVTQEVISALDKKMKTVEVQKISLAELEKQLREAAQAQAEAAKNQ